MTADPDGSGRGRTEPYDAAYYRANRQTVLERNRQRYARLRAQRAPGAADAPLAGTG